MQKALITGSAGLVGSASARFFADKGFMVVGVDNDMRRTFFGDQATTLGTGTILKEALGSRYVPYSIDIRDADAMQNLFKSEGPFDVIIHTAAQPSHDWSALQPMLDFEVNALGTMTLLEQYRQFSPDAVFIFTSTNKVYGDAPNQLPLVELETRYDLPEEHVCYQGIDEGFGIDQSMHTVMGASKAGADLLVQEYGRYFDLATGVFRAGCITGSAHRGVELHGFLAYLVMCIAARKTYRILGYKGKQVRDQIHASDLAHMFWHFYRNPRKGEVYNVGGSRSSNLSVLEAIQKVEARLGVRATVEYVVDARVADHTWYVSDIRKFKTHYPEWRFGYTVDDIVAELCDASL